MILFMKEILHQLIGSFSHYRVLYIPGGDRGISSILSFFPQNIAPSKPIQTWSREDWQRLSVWRLGEVMGLYVVMV